MDAFFASGHVVDFVLAVMAVEAIALGLYFRATSRGIAFADLLVNLVSGTCLLFALRASLTGQSWPWIAVPLSASLLVHLVDLSRRWRRNARLPSMRAAVHGDRPQVP